MRTLEEVRSNRAIRIVDSGLDGFAGVLTFKAPVGKAQLRFVASWGAGWDHVSVGLQNRTPKYQEMKAVRRALFHDHEWVVEYHPPEADYISVNNNVLHLWRPQTEVLPVPSKWMV